MESDIILSDFLICQEVSYRLSIEKYANLQICALKDYAKRANKNHFDKIIFYIKGKKITLTMH